MKKLIIAVTLVFLFLSCGPTEKEKYEALFDDDNPLIGTWELSGWRKIAFIDDSTVHFFIYDQTLQKWTDRLEVYTYEFDRTPREPDGKMKVTIFVEDDSLFYFYDPSKKYLYYPQDGGEPLIKIKK